jgi:16S rRNA (uracil1498-N3)-methyltransferase
MGEPSHPGFRARFFVQSQPSPGTDLALSAEDSHHAARVLRLRVGDRCEVVALSGRAYEAVVAAIADSVRVTVGGELDMAEAGASYRIEVGIVQALARPSAVDLTVEKGTEVGASFFLLVQAHGSPRAEGKDLAGKLTRWRRIALEAAKQSKQTAVPRIEQVASVWEGLKQASEDGWASVVLEPGASATLAEIVPTLIGGEEPAGSGERLVEPRAESAKIALWIGPEGGWTPEELEAFATAGARAARLGRSVLRTETAGPVAVAVTRLALEDW